MRAVLRAFKQFVVHVFTNYRIYLMVIFVLTAGNEIPLPEWLSTILGTIMVLAIVLSTLSRRPR